MHSRVFELSKTKIEEESFLRESDLCYEDGMPITVADYISDSDREEDIEWFVESLVYGTAEGWTYNKEEQSITFTKDFRKSYFKGRLEALKEHVAKLSLDSFSQNFAVNDEVSVYALLELINDRYGFYVYCGGYKPLDSFVRDLQYEFKSDDIKEVTYYFGGTLDYHV